MSKPVIAINTDYRSAKNDNPAFAYTAAGYFDAILQAGGLPILVPPYECEADIDQMLDRVEGVMLIGGADLDPRRDGWMLHPTVRLQDSRRESFDRMLVRLVAERRLPVLGIGAGMQLINVSQGGNLMLHIPDDMPNALPHKDPLDPDHRHTLHLVGGSIMDRVYGDGELRVNSMHHMAVDDVAPGFEVTARCPDGVAEAIESTMSDWFAFGTQFHPEASTASALDMRIFEEFLTGVEQFRGSMRLVA
ncbi:MAG TPA: gamma-glutamyl-gamma-aminobutyrate hydrolase family protein [Lacipirellulaceae bacterium]|nr:gamma-glutamyl-gamma-aminobutyrate hydrolase family protein [Lacipirellulaceae bacterium]